ncbi:hypothetical protein GOP47_0010440 [Adiantum capillus-veneris]|uniref:Uncharacterized protein n=1 Tax=Adiantum capillus-veneris TaxID=13818 RepID=A0A9D4UUX5_ADICA|nr:hypothetical protein GOP47_0010440 [Adiantum capillus-veneris]
MAKGWEERNGVQYPCLPHIDIKAHTIFIQAKGIFVQAGAPASNNASYGRFYFLVQKAAIVFLYSSTSFPIWPPTAT